MASVGDSLRRVDHRRSAGKAPTGAQWHGKDTEDLSASEMTAYFFTDTPPPTYGDETQQPVELGEFGRFSSVAEAIAYAEGAGNQGPITVRSDGSLVNQNGQLMRYDSDGNLAPYGMAEPIDSPAAEPAELGEFGRFSSAAEAIAYAEGAGGQGPITIRSDGSLVNQYGELMGYDSDGNLAPSGSAPPIDEPEDVMPTIPAGLPAEQFAALLSSPSGAELVQQIESIGADYILATVSEEQVALVLSKFGEDPAFTQWLERVISSDGDETQQPVELGEFGRFSSVAEAIAYAEGAGNQGPITVRSDGSLVNQNGQLMRYDSDGNLAPYGMAEPIDSPAAEPAELGEFGRFSSAAEAIAYAEGAGGQGPITIRSDGSLVNQYGELMGYDSDGNLAPSGSAPPIDEPEDVMPTIPTGLPAEQFAALLSSPSGRACSAD